MNEAPDMLKAACWYAKQGFPVFPCKPRAKEPLTLHGFKDATTDQARIAEWWREWPDANIGVPTGVVTGFMVVDIDPRNGGDDSLDELRRQHGAFPDTAEQVTGGGGRHLVFRHSGCFVPKTLAPGIDLKGDGGYVVVAPSIHPSGNRYKWDGIEGAKALFHPAEVPAWLLERMQSPPNSSRRADPDATKWPPGTRNDRLTSRAGTMKRSGFSREAIEAALLEENRTRCEPPLPDAEVRGIAASIARYTPADETSWPLPEPIQSELPPVPAFSEELLPDSLRPLVRDVAERMQVPKDYPAAVVVLCLAGVVNRRAIIQPKARDTGWVIVPNLWGGVIAPPGFMKSPVIQAATRPLSQIQTEWRKNYEEDLKRHADAKEEFELKHSAWRDQYKTNTKNKKDAPERPGDKPEEPKLRRLIVNDSTFEALHETMSENPAGILVIRDELTGWWSQLDRAGREGERAFCLQAWNGDTGHTIDRIGRGTIHVPHCCMSMLGGIQPGRLRSYLVDALRDGPSNDGLIQRFQVLVWPNSPANWVYVDRAADAASEEMAMRVFRNLVEVGADTPARFRFAPDAQELFVAFLAELEAKVRGNDLHAALISHLSKYRSLMPSLALLFELADGASSVGFDGVALANSQNLVTLKHAQQAAAFCDYLESHARRVYSCIVTPQLRAARELADKIKTRKLGADFSCRDVYLKGWSGLDTPEAAKLAADLLQDAGWIKPLANEPGTPGGRPSTRYQVNPRVWE